MEARGPRDWTIVKDIHFVVSSSGRVGMILKPLSQTGDAIEIVGSESDFVDLCNKIADALPGLEAAVFKAKFARSFKKGV